MYRKIVWTIGLLLFLLAGCVTATPTSTPAPAAPTAVGAPTATAAPEPTVVPAPTAAGARTLTVMTHDSFSVSEAVVAKFQEQCNCQVQFLKSGDAGLALNKAILSKNNPLADVFYGVDNTFLGRALAADIFESYDSPALAGIPADLKLDPSNRLLPVDFGYVTLNYDKKYFADNGIPLPQSLTDLTKPAYKGLLAVENPATSSPGLAFLLATVAVFGEQGDYTYLDFWRELRANDVYVADGWEDAYNGQFSGGSGQGDHPLVVSYATSPAAEVYFADPQPAESPTGNIAPAGGSFRQVEFVGKLKGAKNPDLAQQWIDFMLGEAFQADIPLQMWVYPTRTGTPLPEVFTQFAQEPAAPAQLSPEQIDAGRDAWLKAWTDAVLR
jgi:thiamine transport system substrate-binding protein